jgi:hypothetical protein
LLTALGAVLVPALVAGGVARAASIKGPNLEVTIILATHSDGGESIDPALKDLPQLTRDQPFVRYNAYKLLDRKTFPLDASHPVTDTLANGRTLQVTLDGVAQENQETRYQLEAQIAKPGKKAFLKSLQVTASANEPFFVGGQRYHGGTLFVELVVRP